MKLFVRYIVIINLALLLSWIAYTIIYEIVEYLYPSKRFDAEGHPNFVMPTFAIFCGLIISFITFILATIWMNKIFINKFEN